MFVAETWQQSSLLCLAEMNCHWFFCDIHPPSSTGMSHWWKMKTVCLPVTCFLLWSHTTNILPTFRCPSMEVLTKKGDRGLLLNKQWNRNSWVTFISDSFTCDLQSLDLYLIITSAKTNGLSFSVQVCAIKEDYRQCTTDWPLCGFLVSREHQQNKQANKNSPACSISSESNPNNNNHVFFLDARNLQEGKQTPWIPLLILLGIIWGTLILITRRGKQLKHPAFNWSHM